ncbi:MAG: A24 family peptidase [Eubacteriales bacterium]|nr:A24 family peptidase [Eubacteriales bacterium]
MILILKPAVVIVFYTSALVYEIKTGKISNRLIIAAVSAGLLLSVLEDGLNGMLSCVNGILLPGAVLFVLYYFNALGAGGAKLIAASGAIMGRYFALRLTVLSFAAAAVMALCHELIKNRKGVGLLFRRCLSILPDALYPLLSVTKLQVIRSSSGKSGYSGGNPGENDKHQSKRLNISYAVLISALINILLTYMTDITT